MIEQAPKGVRADQLVEYVKADQELHRAIAQARASMKADVEPETQRTLKRIQLLHGR